MAISAALILGSVAMSQRAATSPLARMSDAQTRRVRFRNRVPQWRRRAGSGFRLDIIGNDIADDALADYLVRDLRLLMVESVRILHKRIIAEPHKRSA